MKRYDLFLDNTFDYQSDTQCDKSQHYGNWPGTNLDTICVESTNTDRKSFDSIYSVLMDDNYQIMKNYMSQVISNLHQIQNKSLDEKNFFQFSNFIEKSYEIPDNYYKKMVLRKVYFVGNSIKTEKPPKLILDKITPVKSNINSMKDNYLWLKNNSKKIEFIGKWVALENGILLDFSKSYKTLVHKLQDKKSKGLLITKII